MQSIEQQLLSQLNDLTISRSTAFSNIHGYLSQQTCWWCQHYELANCVLELFVYQHNPTVQQIWQTMSQQLAGCTDCINNYHTAQTALFEDFHSARPLLEVLRQLDKQRLLTWAATQQPQADGVQAAGDAAAGYAAAGVLSTHQLFALFELLGYSHYLDDAELCDAAVQLLQQVGWALETSEGTPYAGLFRLLAHPDSSVRSKALSVVKPMGPLDNMELAGHTLSEVLDCWLTSLQQQLGQLKVVEQLSSAAQHQLLVPVGQQQQWQRPSVWSALKAVMGMLQGECMTSAAELYPAILPTVLAQATPGAYAIAAAGGSMPGAQAQPPAAILHGFQVAPEGSLEQKHALGCLHSLLLGLAHEFWQLSTAPASSQQLVQQLQSSVWAAVRLNDTNLLRALLQVLQALAESLLPCLRNEAVFVPDSDEEQDLAFAARDVVGAESKAAVLECVKLLLVQLPGSAAVPLLMRGLALEAGLAVCMSALQSPRCPGTAMFAHLWAPVAAALLVVPQDQYISLQGAALQQHQAPGIVQMLPVLRQMVELQDRITGAAAGLVATALQADAAVLHDSLSKQPSTAAANKAWLVPSALDVVELSLNNALEYQCAPSMWLALAGCGHAVVSASFIAAAAQLVPLASLAAGAATRMQTGSAQQELEASLLLPDPETVDILSTSHAVYALDCAGWLHQQFTRAAVRHMHICSCRSRLFLLSPSINTVLKSPGQGGQQQIDAMFRQHAASSSPPPDNTDAAAYALAVRGCCTLMVQGKSGPAAVLAGTAEHALLSSCGVPLGQVQQAVQQHLLAPGSVCAEGVVQALQQELQCLLEQGKVVKAFLKGPEQLCSFFTLSGCALGAAIMHDLDVMLPLFAGFLPGLWQLSVDALTTGCKLITSATACATCSSSNQGQQQQGHHTGPGIGSVLRALLDALPALWQCYQAFIKQRCEQRQLYLDAADELLMLTPMTQDGTPRQGAAGAATAVAAALHREAGWLVHLLGLGRQLHAATAGENGCACIRSAAGDRHLRLAWRACLDDVVKGTRLSLPKAVKAAATDLMQSNEPSLDTLWLAQLFPSAAPGNLGGTGLGGWPSRKPAGTKVPQAPAPPAAPQQPSAKLLSAASDAAPAPAGFAAAGPIAAAAGASGVTRQISIDLNDYDIVELLGEELSESSDHAAGDKRGSDRDSDVIIVSSDDFQEQLEQQQDQQLHHQELPTLQAHVQQPSGSQSWPWLRRDAVQQPPRQQAPAAAKPDLAQQQLDVKQAVSRLLQSSKTLHSTAETTAAARTPQQKQRQQQEDQQQQAAAAEQERLLQRLSSEQQPPPWVGRSHAKPTAIAAAAAAGSASEHLLRFKPPSKAAAAAAAAAAGNDKPSGPPSGALKRVKRPDSNNASAPQPPDQHLQQQQYRASSRQGSEDPNLTEDDSLWPEEWRDIKGAHAPEQYPVYRYNRESLRPRKPPAPAGLSKGDQVRVELLGKGPVGDSDADEAALAAELIAAAGVTHGRRRPMAATGQQQQHRRGTGRHDGVSAAGRAALNRAAAALVQQQQQAQEPELLLQRMQQRKQEEQQQALLRQQQQQAREERRRQLEAARAAEAEPTAQQNQQQAAAASAGRAGISLVNDDALFKQAAAASAANRPKARVIRMARHQGPLFLRSSRPTATGFGAPRAAPGKEYPTLRLEDVWAELLSWGYQGAVGSSSQNGSAAAAAAAAATRKLLEEGRVPLRFTSVGHYCAVFRGLLLEELRAGLAAAHEEHVAGSTSNNGPNTRGMGFRCMPVVIDSVQRQSKASVVVAQVDTNGLQPRERDSPRSEDFVLLTRVQLSSGSELSEDCLPRSHLSGLVVEASMLQPGLRQVTLHVAPESGGSQVMAQFWRQLLAPGTQLWLTVIRSLVPNFREFQALIAMQHAPPGDRLLRHVLHPEPPKSAGGTTADLSSTQQLEQLPAGLRDALKASYNSSQCAAVSACLDKRYPFVLVQGPPGTGKTSAIVGMLSALLGQGESQRGSSRGQGATGRGRGGAARQSRALEASAASGSNSSLPAHAAQSALKLGVIPPVRVLVCAQSNAAIDELLIRMANSGVWCGSGSRRAPAMVRMGRSDAMHASILMFHVDALADAAVQQQAQERAREAAEAVYLGQQQLQQQQAQGANASKAGSKAGAAGGQSLAAAAGQANPSGGQSALEAKMQELRERLRAVEDKLAALTMQGAVGGASNAAAAAGQPQQQGLSGQKRSEAGSDAAPGAMPPPPSKLPRAAPDADVAAGRAAAAADEPQSSGSDMDVSDGEGQAGGTGRETSSSKVQQQPKHPSSYHGHSSKDRGRSRSGSRARGSRAGRRSSRSPQRHSSRSPGRHHRSSRQDRGRNSDSHRRSSRSRSESPGRRKRSRRSRSRGRGSASPEKRRSDRDRGHDSSRARREERSRGSSRDGERRRDSSRSRSRGRYSGGSNRAADREHADSRGHSRHTDKDKHSSRTERHGSSRPRSGSRDGSGRADPHGDRHLDSNHSSRNTDRSAKDGKDAEQGGSSSRHNSSSRDAEDSRATADKNIGFGKGPSGLQQQQRQQEQAQEPGVQQPPAANAALLRDQQRSLLAKLRELEREAQQAEAVPAVADRRELDRARKGARQAVIQAAEVVLCTLSASGGDLLNAFPPGVAPLFDVVVVDEAAQALEPATLIPFQLIKPGSGRVVLVGDPCQLPPTVLSKAAEASMLAQSLFERLARAGWPVQLLQEQYRSHPAISAFPSRFFYQGKLLDGSGINAVSKGAPWHSKLAFGPMVVWDCQEGRERGGGSRGGGSLQNPAEAELAATLVAGLLSEHRSDVGSIAVISPYRAQVACLRNEFRRQLGGDTGLAAANIEFGTVDGFQGREADVVVFSCVRAQPEAAAAAAAAAALSGSGSGAGGGGPRIGFLQDVRRMNVGLTRGRRAVWVVCHADTLTASPAWRPLLQEARSRGVLLSARYPFRRLLTAGERQLRGSYWTPDAAVASPPGHTASLQAAAVLPQQPLPEPASMQPGPEAPSAATATTGAVAAAAATAAAVHVAAKAGLKAAAAPAGPAQVAARAAGADCRSSREAAAAAAAAGSTHVAVGPASVVGRAQQSKTGAAAANAGGNSEANKRLSKPSAGPSSSAAASATVANEGRGGAAGTTGQQAPRQVPQQKKHTGPAAAGLASKSIGGSSSAPLRAPQAHAKARATGGAAAVASARGPTKPQPRQQPAGADVEAAAWAAADAARAATAGRKDAGGTAEPKAAAAPGGEQTLLRRVQQQQEQQGQQLRPAGQSAEGRPIGDAGKSTARRTVLRPGQQTPAAVRNPPPPASQPQRQQQRQVQPPAGNQQRGPRQPGAAAGRAVRGTQAQRGAASSRPAASGAAQQQSSQAELRAALLARLQKQGKK